MTVWFVILLFKSAFVQLLQTERTNEMFWVELSEHSGDASASDWFMASSAQGTSFGVVVSFTVRISFVVEEAATDEWTSTILNENSLLLD